MALRVDKAYVRHLRADTYANLIATLKDGELGLVVGGKRIVMNDNGTYLDFGVVINGTVLLTLTGVAGIVQVTAKYEKVRNFAKVYIPAMTGTSNANTCTITGLAGAADDLLPPALNGQLRKMLDAGSGIVTEMRIAAGGTITCRKNILTGTDNTWSPTGTKGLETDITLEYYTGT